MKKKEVKKEELAKIAHLSKLDFTGDELETMTKDFNQILDFVGQVEEAVLADEELLFDNPLSLTNEPRHDEPKESVCIEDIRKLTPNFEAGFFVVPKVIES